MKNYVSREQTPNPGMCDVEAFCRRLQTAGVGSLLRVGGSLNIDFGGKNEAYGPDSYRDNL